LGSVAGEAEDRDGGIAAANFGSEQVVCPDDAQIIALFWRAAVGSVSC
jgi:hypothetical protein